MPLKLSIGLPTDKVQLGDQFTSGDAVMEMARTAEEAGFDAVHVTDHPFPEDEWMASGGHHALDPWVPLSFAAAATTKILLQTHILVLPYRNPFLTAKSVTSLDVLSGGRVILGVAAGYLEPEFKALGVDYAERNELTDEAILAMKLAWTQDGVSLKGRHFEAVGHSMLPKPVQRPHPPIWIGGNSKQAIRRAVDMADGWIPIPNMKNTVSRRKTPAFENLEDLSDRLDYARGYSEEVGRDESLDIVFVPFGLGDFGNPKFDPVGFVEVVKTLDRMGVTWLSLNLPSANRKVFLENMQRFSEDVMRKLP